MISIPAGVLCCGNLVQDILVRPVTQVVFDRTTWVDSIELSIGGNGANTAFALATLGTPVRLVSFAGADPFGESIVRQLQQAGVDTACITQAPGERTATTVALVNSEGARAFLHDPGVNRIAFRDGLDIAAIAGSCSHFHLANPFALVEMRCHAGTLMASARAAGLTTSLDGGWDARGLWMETLGPCLPNTDVIFLNAEESRMLSGRDEPSRAAAFFRDRGVASVVIKTGAEGCLLFEAGAGLHVPAFPVDAVDTTGAGDCFASGFLSALHRGMDAPAAARFANAVGALSVRKLGAVAGLLPFDQTLAWISQAEASAPGR